MKSIMLLLLLIVTCEAQKRTNKNNAFDDATNEVWEESPLPPGFDIIEAKLIPMSPARVQLVMTTRGDISQTNSCKHAVSYQVSMNVDNSLVTGPGGVDVVLLAGRNPNGNLWANFGAESEVAQRYRFNPHSPKVAGNQISVILDSNIFKDFPMAHCRFSILKLPKKSVIDYIPETLTYSVELFGKDPKFSGYDPFAFRRDFQLPHGTYRTHFIDVLPEVSSIDFEFTPTSFTKKERWMNSFSCWVYDANNKPICQFRVAESNKKRGVFDRMKINREEWIKLSNPIEGNQTEAVNITFNDDLVAIRVRGKTYTKKLSVKPEKISLSVCSMDVVLEHLVIK